MARLTENDPVEVRIQAIPNVGKTLFEKRPRHWCVDRLIHNQAFESGTFAQEQDMGINVITLGSHPELGPVPTIMEIFMQTKPECRLTEAQIQDSLNRGHGEDLFSQPTQARTE